MFFRFILLRRQAGAVSCEAAAACAETAGRRRRRRKKATSKTTGTSAASLEEESEEEPASPTLCAAVVVPARRRLCKRGATVSGRKMCISVFSRSDDAVEVDALLVESTRRLALSLPRARVTAALGRAVPCASAPARHQHDFCEALLAALRLDAHEELSVLEPPSSEDAQPTHPPVAETTTPLPVPPLTQRGAPVASRALPPPRVPDTPPPRVPDAPALQHLVPEIERCCAAFDCDKFWRPLAQPLHVALAELAAAEVARTSGDAVYRGDSRLSPFDASLSPSLSLSLSLALSLVLALSLALSLCVSLALCLSLSLALALCLSLSRSLSELRSARGAASGGACPQREYRFVCHGVSPESDSDCGECCEMPLAVRIVSALDRPRKSRSQHSTDTGEAGGGRDRALARRSVQRIDGEFWARWVFESGSWTWRARLSRAYVWSAWNDRPNLGVLKRHL